MSGLVQLDDLLAVISRALIRSRGYGLWPDDQRLERGTQPELSIASTPPATRPIASFCCQGADAETSPYLKALRRAQRFLASGESRELHACASELRCIARQGRFWGDTEVAAPFAIDRCRARAQRVIEHADLARPDSVRAVHP